MDDNIEIRLPQDSKVSKLISNDDDIIFNTCSDSDLEEECEKEIEKIRKSNFDEIEKAVKISKNRNVQM